MQSQHGGFCFEILNLSVDLLLTEVHKVPTCYDSARSDVMSLLSSGASRTGRRMYSLSVRFEMHQRYSLLLYRPSAFQKALGSFGASDTTSIGRSCHFLLDWSIQRPLSAGLGFSETYDSSSRKFNFQHRLDLATMFWGVSLEEKWVSRGVPLVYRF